MIPFRTEIHIPPSSLRITHQAPMLFVGSCFTENIGVKLKELAFPVEINPTGIVYNPVSVKRCIDLLLRGKMFDEADLQFYNQLYFSFDHDTSFSNPEKALTLESINSALNKGVNRIKEASVLLITFGTAWVYVHKKQQQFVSNCHKIPSAEFERKLLSVDEIVDAYIELIDSIKKVNPGIRIVFTISPVRHWKDGAVGNQVSKSTLVLALHKLLEYFPDNTGYFPAYELMLDDLRDYRFYSDDLLHPSSKAIEYIWEKFSSTYFDTETHEICKEVSELSAAARHKPFNINTHATKQFKETHLKKTVELGKKYPFLDLSYLQKHFSC